MPMMSRVLPETSWPDGAAGSGYVRAMDSPGTWAETPLDVRYTTMPLRTSEVDGLKPESGMLSVALAAADEPADGDALAERLGEALEVALAVGLAVADAEAEEDGDADDDDVGAASVASARLFQGSHI